MEPETEMTLPELTEMIRNASEEERLEFCNVILNLPVKHVLLDGKVDFVKIFETFAAKQPEPRIS